MPGSVVLHMGQPHQELGVGCMPGLRHHRRHSGRAHQVPIREEAAGEVRRTATTQVSAGVDAPALMHRQTEAMLPELAEEYKLVSVRFQRAGTAPAVVGKARRRRS
jgi:hypothetical protein